MPLLQLPFARAALLVLALLLAASASAQDGAFFSGFQGLPPATGVADEPSGRSFHAPDRSRLEYQSVQATFTVTSDADSGPGSLREAIDLANANPGLDVIAFAIGGGGTYAEIFLQTKLPLVTDPVVIDGDTQGCDTAQGLCIRLDGEPLVDDPNEFDYGLGIAGGGSTIHGLLFTRFFQDDNLTALTIISNDNTVTGCYFGTDRTGMVTDPDGVPGSGDELGNGFGLSLISGGGFTATGNVIGGATAAERNVVGGSTFSGILLQGAQVTGNLVVGNYSGTNADGSDALPNVEAGILINTGASGNTIEGNLASGNEGDGVVLQEGSSNNLVTGNFIGTNAAGTAAIPNGTLAGLPSFAGMGLDLGDGTGNVIEDNLISGNLLVGVFFGGRALGGTVTDNVFRRNLVGTDVTGTLPIPNGVSGIPDTGAGIILIDATGTTDVSGNVVGGSAYADANVFGFNTTAGVALQGPGVTGNIIDHNLIGVDANIEPVPNGQLGILVRDFVGANRIGSLSAEPRQAGESWPGEGFGSGGPFPAGNIIGFQPLGVGVANESRGIDVAFNYFTGLTGAFLPIDLGLDGPPDNDAADPDEGPNRLQNTPVIQAATLSGDQLTVTFLVDTAPTNAAYPLTVRFYGRAVQDGFQGYAPIGSATYASMDAQQPVTVTLTNPQPIPPGVMPEVVATATDADGNTGEMALMGIVIPVELTTFEAVLDGTTASLVWQTASETNNAGFEVEARSSQDGAWNALGFVEGHGTTTEAQTYAFTVRDLATGTHTFRLKQLDFDGTATYSGEVEVSVGLPGTHRLGAAYPNPFNPSAQFTLDVAESQVVEIALYNVIGQRVALLQNGRLEAGVAHTLTIDGRGLASGAYFVRISGETFQDGLRVTLMK